MMLHCLYVIEPTPVSPASSDDDDEPVYKEVWFIALIAILALAILFIALACCLRATRHKVFIVFLLQCNIVFIKTT